MNILKNEQQPNRYPIGFIERTLHLSSALRILDGTVPEEAVVEPVVAEIIRAAAFAEVPNTHGPEEVPTPQYHLEQSNIIELTAQRERRQLQIDIADNAQSTEDMQRRIAG